MTRPSIDVRHASHPETVRTFGTAELRRHFLIQDLFVADEIKLTYSHIERMIVGGATPVAGALTLQTVKEVGQPTFLARRELGIINIAGPGSVTVDGTRYTLANKEALYVGMGAKDVVFESDDAAKPAKFYLLSTPAHTSYPTRTITGADGNTLQLGDVTKSNKRKIHQMLIPSVVQSCQLVFGMTTLEAGSVWNTMPCHVHDRRNEVYLYFDLAEDARVFHLMGEPDETRHLVVAEGEAVISPPWSIHSGCGTSAYTFIWAMGGDNQDYADMDMVPMAALR